MATSHEQLADAIEAGGRGFAGFAASLLLERRPDLSGPFGQAGAVPFARWREQFERMFVELAAAARFGRPELLASAWIWQRRAFVVRDLDASVLEAALAAMREVLGEHLPEALRPGCTNLIDQVMLLTMGHDEEEPAALLPNTDAQREALHLLRHLLEGDRRLAVDRVLQAVDRGMSMRSAYLDVVVPALREIGRMWHTGELSIAEEHLCTEAIRSLLAVLAHRMPAVAPNGLTAVVAAVSGNGHDLAVRIVADFLEQAGFRAICLGADVPDDEVMQAIEFFDAHVLMLSATLLGHLRAIRRVIELARREGPPELRIVVGGGALAPVPGLWRELGADGWAATADEAPIIAERLLGRAPDGPGA